MGKIEGGGHVKFILSYGGGGTCCYQSSGGGGGLEKQVKMWHLTV